MNEVTIFFVVLLIVLGIVTVIGHGIWVLVARIFGGASSAKNWPRTPLASSERMPTECPRCHTPLDAFQKNCSVCGWPEVAWEPLDGTAALRAIRRQLELLGQRGALDAEARSQLYAVINEQEQRLVALKAASPMESVAETVDRAPANLAEVADDGVTLPGRIVAAMIEEPPDDSDGVPVIESQPPLSHVAEPVGERVRKYAASREAAMSEAEPIGRIVVDPPPKREALARLFAAFMEEKNIRWGELVGGLLIVGCSIALVISFWSQIAARPVLKFVLFNGVTAALFGVGIYTDRQWKIRTTSRGVLAIATLLVPLNFLAIAAFTQASPPTDLLSLAGEALSLAAFATLVYFAGRILVPQEPILLAAGVILPCLMQLLVRRFAASDTPLATSYVLAGVPIVGYLLVHGVVVHRRWLPLAAADQAPAQDGASSWFNVFMSAADSSQRVASSLSELDANRTLLFLGLVSAATLMPLALLLHNVPPIMTTLHWHSPLVAACGLPALLTGLLFWRRLTDREHSGLQTSGVGVGVLGAVIMAAAVVFAWPDPATLLPTALATAVVMLIIAVVFKIPAAHVPAGVALIAAWLTCFYVIRGDVGWALEDSATIRRLYLSATSGHALVPIVVVFGALAAVLGRFGRREAGSMYAVVAAGAMAVSLALVIGFGFARMGDPYNATWTLAIYTVAAFAVTLVLERRDAAYTASALLLLTLGQAIVYRFNPSWQLAHSWGVALLIHAFVVASLCAILQFARTQLPDESQFDAAQRVEVLRALSLTTHVTSFAAAVWLAMYCTTTPSLVLSVRLAVLGIVWLLLAALNESAVFITASQIAFVLAIFCGVTAVVETREWYAASPRPWLDPWFLEAQGIALAGYCLLRSALRWWIKRRLNEDEDVLSLPPPRWIRTFARMVNPPWPAVDEIVIVSIAILLIAIATYAVLPGVAQELSPTEVAGSRVVTPIEQFEIAGIPHTHAAGVGAWLLLMAVAAAVAARLARTDIEWQQVGLVGAGIVACVLIAARFDGQVAVASALRWLAAALFAFGSVAIWILTRTKARAVAGIQAAANEPSTWFTSFIRIDRTSVRDLLVAFNMLVYVALGAYVAQGALWRGATTPIGAPATAWFFCIAWSLVGGVVAAILFVASVGERGAHRAAQFPLKNVESWASQVRWVALLAAAAPLVVVLMFSVAKVLDGQPLVGPEPSSWFRRIGFEWSYGVPLAVIAVMFIGYALRDHSAEFGFAAGLLFNVVATIVLLLRLARGSGVLDATAWIIVAQINTIVAGLVAAVWLAGDYWHAVRSRAESVRAHESPLLLAVQVALAGVLCASFLVPTTTRLAIAGLVPGWVAGGGSLLGWCGLVLAIGTAGWLRRERGVSQWYVATAAAGLIGAIALTMLGQGWSYPQHALLVGCCIAAWATPTLTWLVNRSRKINEFSPNLESAAACDYGWATAPVRFFDAAAVALALWEFWTFASWWIVAALVAIAARNLVIAWREGRRGSVWIAAVLSTIGVSIWWLSLLRVGAAMRGPGDFFAYLWINILAAAVIAIASVWIERRRARIDSERSLVRASWGIAFHRFAAWAIVVVLLLTTGAGLLADLSNHPIVVRQPLAWAAWFAAAAIAIAGVWDPAIRWPVPCLYLVGLLAVGLYLDGLNLQAPLFHWALANALAAYSLATSALWSVRDRLRSSLARIGMPVRPTMARASGEFSAAQTGDGHGWLVTANLILGVGVLLLVVWIEQVVPSFTQRMVGAYAIGAQAFAIGLLARGAVRTSLQYAALAWGVLFAVAFAWSFVPPDFAAPWLHRLVVTVAALAVTVVAYGFGLVKFFKRENEWVRAAERLVPSLAAIAAVLVFVVLGVEVYTYIQHGDVPISPAALATVIVALASLAVAALVAALAPGRDPLGLSERGRTAYVYAAEVLGGLLFLHIRVTMPWLFGGWFMRFWPLVVMAIAFLGVGFGEVFQRRKQRVLSEPLETSGALLPLLPALGFWVKSSEVDYSLLLLSIGVLYAALGVLRRSFSYGVLAAVAANGSLWYFLHRRNGLDFTEHPQLWLIPPALCALAAGYINRERLTAQQSAALRYASAILIYVSSTADIFIHGVAEAPWLPAVLAGISIVGVLAGILLRVRAFLYLGTAFLAVALITVIWHAAEEHTWIWWIAGIVTGVLIIALFGVFEKRRDDVLRVVEELKHWQV